MVRLCLSVSLCLPVCLSDSVCLDRQRYFLRKKMVEKRRSHAWTFPKGGGEGVRWRQEGVNVKNVSVKELGVGDKAIVQASNICRQNRWRYGGVRWRHVLTLSVGLANRVDESIKRYATSVKNSPQASHFRLSYGNL